MRIALLGDIALFGGNTVADNTYKERFGAMKELLAGCDYVIGNLETPLTYRNRTIGGKSAYIKGSPEDAEILAYLGITHVSLANNHVYDYGSQGLKDTLDALDRNGIEWYGVKGKNIRIEKNGSTVTLSGYCCYSTNGKGMGIVNVLDPLVIEKEIRSSVDALPIVSLHWGQEHVHYPNYDHVEVARKLCNNRQIVIHGHHPHVIQGIENVQNSLVAYSLGNFCFDDVYTSKSRDPLIKLSKDNMESFVFILEVENSEISNYQVVPFSFANNYYSIDNLLLDKISDWSEFLSINKDLYKVKRSGYLSTYYEGRKAARNLEWYLKRLNIESVRMILSARYNKKQYKLLIDSYINE